MKDYIRRKHVEILADMRRLERLQRLCDEMKAELGNMLVQTAYVLWVQKLSRDNLAQFCILVDQYKDELQRSRTRVERGEILFYTDTPTE